MKKTIHILTLCLLFSLFLVGCNSKDDTTKKEVQQLAKIEIYSGSGDLISTVDDEETLNQFNNLDFVDISSDTDSGQAELKNNVDSLTVLYTIVSYKKPVALINDGTLEKLMEITVYENSNIIKEQVAPENIKVVAVAEEFLTFYTTLSEEDKEFILTLAKPNEKTANIEQNSKSQIDYNVQEADISDVAAFDELVYKEYSLGEKFHSGEIVISKETLLNAVKEPKAIIIYFNDKILETIDYNDADIQVNLSNEGMYCFVIVDKDHASIDITSQIQGTSYPENDGSSKQ